jgi:hypothetical protein
MSETPEDFRQRVELIDSKFYEDFEKRGGPFRDQAFEFDKLAVDYSRKGFQTLTYLNGGALVAIPTAMAFFKADVAKLEILITAGAFILGLLSVVVAEICAFFTMAKRAEGQDAFRWEQFNLVAALTLPNQTPLNIDYSTKAAERHAIGEQRNRTSDVWRLVGLVFFAASLVAFVGGCLSGGLAVMAAKEKVETRQR